MRYSSSGMEPTQMHLSSWDSTQRGNKRYNLKPKQYTYQRKAQGTSVSSDEAKDYSGKRQQDFPKRATFQGRNSSFHNKEYRNGQRRNIFQPKTVEFANKWKREESQHLVKVWIRNLPPSLDEDEFRQALETSGNSCSSAVWCQFFSGSPANKRKSLSLAKKGFAFLAFYSVEDALNFEREYGGMKLKDTKSGVEYAMKILRCLFPKVPAKFRYRDPLVGTIYDDSDFRDFLESVVGNDASINGKEQDSKEKSSQEEEESLQQMTTAVEKNTSFTGEDRGPCTNTDNSPHSYGKGPINNRRHKTSQGSHYVPVKQRQAKNASHKHTASPADTSQTIYKVKKVPERK
eukprot:jgi/Galph1/1893/GphlegSOOS_G565.1